VALQALQALATDAVKVLEVTLLGVAQALVLVAALLFPVLPSELAPLPPFLPFLPSPSALSRLPPS
jgi:hypothetical protein